MSTDSTGNNGPLSFADKLSFSERKRLKCFPAMMHIEQIATLEHPDSLERQKTLALALIDACERGELPSIPDQQYDDGWIEDGLVFGWWHKTLELCEGPTPIISREAYQAWRAQYPARLLPDLSHIGAWLGATPPVETSLPEPARPASVAKPKKRRRNDAMSNAIQAALAVLSPSGGALPRPADLFDYLVRSDATKTIRGVAKGNRALLWIDDNGNEQILTFSALTKRLNRIRQGA